MTRCLLVCGDVTILFLFLLLYANRHHKTGNLLKETKQSNLSKRASRAHSSPLTVPHHTISTAVKNNLTHTHSKQASFISRSHDCVCTYTYERPCFPRHQLVPLTSHSNNRNAYNVFDRFIHLDVLISNRLKMYYAYCARRPLN